MLVFVKAGQIEGCQKRIWHNGILPCLGLRMSNKNMAQWHTPLFKFKDVKQGYDTMAYSLV